MSNGQHKNGNFTSTLGFVIACVGSAVGLGNIWMFPYRLGQYGGAAFLIPYLLFILLFGWVGLSAEFAVGRKARTGTIGAYGYCFAARDREKTGKVLGWFPLLGSLGIAIGYSIVLGWVLRSLAGAVTGSLFETDAAEYFAQATGAFGSVPWHFIIVAVVSVILLTGVTKGIEKVSKVMMPLFFVLFVILAVRVAFLPGAAKGYEFLFVPRWEALLKVDTWVMAMGQAFFTLSLGIGAMAIFGSYIGKERTLLSESVNITLLDTFVALMAGLIILPACFSFGVNPGQGPGLVFVTLPNIFGGMAGGRVWGALFFVFMSFAALSTVIAVFENIVAFGMDLWGWSRKKAVLVNFFAILVLSLPCVLGYNVLSGFMPFGEGSAVLDLEDFLVSNTILPLGSLVYLLFCTSRYGWGWKNFVAEADEGKGIRFPKWAWVYVSYILPLIVLFIFLMGYKDKFFT